MLLKRIDDSHIEYKGIIWTRYPHSKRRSHRVYYWHHSKWKETPRSLHRELYMDFKGKIPDGYHIHHIDGNPENNSIDNLQCLSSLEHNKVYWSDPTNREAQEVTRAKMKAAKNSPEGRLKSSIAQRNRKMSTHKCLLCGTEFKNRCNYIAKWCPDCLSHQTSNKGHRYFPIKWQLERFGEVRIDPNIKLSMIK